MQLTFIIKTQQLPLEEQQHIRHSLSVPHANSASGLPARLCQCTTACSEVVARGYWQLQGQPEPSCSVPQVPGWGKEQHQKCGFALPFEADLSSTWSV